MRNFQVHKIYLTGFKNAILLVKFKTITIAPNFRVDNKSIVTVERYTTKNSSVAIIRSRTYPVPFMNMVKVRLEYSLIFIFFEGKRLIMHALPSMVV